MKKEAIFYAILTGCLYLSVSLYFFIKIFPDPRAWQIVTFILSYVLIFLIFSLAVREANCLFHQFFNSSFEKKKIWQFHYPFWRSLLFWPINLIIGPFATLFFITFFVFTAREILAELKSKKKAPLQAY